jgi:hypothetical protein
VGGDWERRAKAATIADDAPAGLSAGDVMLLHDVDHYGAHGSWRAVRAGRERWRVLFATPGPRSRDRGAFVGAMTRFAVASRSRCLSIPFRERSAVTSTRCLGAEDAAGGRAASGPRRCRLVLRQRDAPLRAHERVGLAGRELLGPIARVLAQALPLAARDAQLDRDPA